MTNNRKHGFSLVELSIVLVILGLLVGGVLSGQSLIRAAELRSVSAEFMRYTTAMNSFRDKYFQIPGDITNAIDFWGVAGGTTGINASCWNIVSTDAKTCNGDGDGYINNNTGNGELFRFWQHLANAGLIEGSYTGKSADGNRTHLAADKTNVPIPKSGGLWYINGQAPFSANALYYDGAYGNALSIGNSISVGVIPSAPTMKPEEAWNIDTKLDDGKPALGKIRPFINSTNCTDNATTTVTTASYTLTNSSKDCGLIFMTGY